MLTLDKPLHDPKTVFLTCISKVRKKEFKTRLESIADNISDDSIEYESYSENAEWYLFAESDDVEGVVSQDEMEKVYTYRMAKKDAPGRGYYDLIKESAPFNICPLCNHRSVEQLDHYLPKSKFPSLVVVPVNLIPTCEKCNKSKLDDVPEGVSDQTLHPYYDDVTEYQWLYAELEQTSPPSLQFIVKEVDEFDRTLNKRIQHHFNTLELDKLYASQTGAYLAGIRHRLIDLYDKAGMDEVRLYLQEEERSRAMNNVNSWQRAMFQAWACSDWFCDGGFKA